MGVRAGQTVGVSALDLYHENLAATEAVREALAGRHTTFESFFGGAYFITRLTPLLDEGGLVREVVGVSVDTGGQVRAEQALDERDAQLRESQKMEAVGQLAGGIAHDFNNLLTTIIGYSDLALGSEDGCSFGAIREDVEEIRRAAERAAGLTRQVLAFSRRQALRPQVTSLNDLLAETEPILRGAVGDDIEIDLLLGPNLGLIEVDRGQLVEVVMNLATNARDAMPDGGLLRLQTANAELDDSQRGVVAEAPVGPYVMLAVSDSGVGMDEDTVPHIFEPFFTTKGQGQGTGLGLSAVYGVVRQSGGDISVESRPGSGTTFRLYFPHVDRLAEGVPPVVGPARLITNEVVMVVEDETGVRDLVNRVLTGRGYSVVTARDAAQALVFLFDQDRPIDLLLTDVVLPSGLQGDALAKKALELRPGLPVLFMSGYPRHLLERGRVIDAGVNYLQKPFTPETLGRRVREVLDTAPR
jgi:two-component system cell cycle sensor histidine kinase/response regulator CckA